MLLRVALTLLALVMLGVLQVPSTVHAVRQRFAEDRTLRPPDNRTVLLRSPRDARASAGDTQLGATGDASPQRAPSAQTTPSPRKSGRHVVSYALDGTVFDTEHDPLEQVIDFIVWQEEKYRNGTLAAAKPAPPGSHNASLAATAAAGPPASSSSSSFLEVSAEVGKVHAFCEICILIMQMKERGQPHLCAGLNPDYFISCVENLESLLRADKAVVYWLRSGCMHLDREGPEIVRPCPAHAICAWVPNLFADVGIVTPRNELSPLCPRDFKYLPRIPRKPVQVATIT